MTDESRPEHQRARLTCVCGWNVYPGLDCDFCGIPADEVVTNAEAAGELRRLRLA